MYKKVARVGPISFGIFYALFVLLMLIILALAGAFLLPLLPIGEAGVPIDGFTTILDDLKQGQGLAEVGITLGFILLGSFLTGFIFAILYNIVALFTGGIKVRVTDLDYDDI